MSIEMYNFSNNPAEYAMLRGWNTDVSSWNVHQQNAYLKWSSSSTIPESSAYADSTTFASSVSSEPTMSSIGSQSTNVISRPEWKTAFDYDLRSLPYIPDIEMKEINEFADMQTALDLGLGNLENGTIIFPSPPAESTFTDYDAKMSEPLDFWEPGVGSTKGNIVGTIPENSMPAIDIQELQGIPEINSALTENFVGLDPYGEAMFSMEGMKSTLGGAGMNLLMGVVMDWMKRNLGTFGEITTDTIQVYGAASMMIEGDPFAFAVTGSMMYASMYAEQLKRIKKNDYAGDTADSRLMMVLDSGKWYPAILKDRLHGEGFGIDTSNSINVAYGKPEDLRFEYEDGKYRAHFIHQKNKQFRLDDSEWDGKESTLEYGTTRDFMRPFYFLDDETTEKILSTYGTKDFSWKVLEQDKSEYTPFMKDMSELQAALDLIQNREMKTDDPTTFLESSSKGIRRQILSQLHDSEHAFEEDTFQNSRGLPDANQQYGLNTTWDSYWRPGKYNLKAIHELNSEVITRKIQTLNRTRALAAQETNVDQSVYTDYAKDLPTAKSFDMLQNQFKAIDNYTDRTTLQKQYLQEKAGVRYLMSFANKMGYSADLYDVINEGADTSFARIAGEEIPPGDYPSTKLGFLPKNYSDSGSSTITEIPAWMNKADKSPFDAEQFDLAGWQVETESHYKQNFDTFYANKIGTLNYDPEEIIQQQGIITRSKAVTLPDIDPGSKKPDKSTKETESYEERLKRIQHDMQDTHGQTFAPDATAHTKPKKPDATAHGPAARTDATAHGPAARTKVKGARSRWVHHQIGSYYKYSEDDGGDPSSLPYWLKRNPHEEIIGSIMPDGKMNYRRFKELVQSGEFRPSDVGAHNLSDVAEALLMGSADWIPKNLSLSEANFPTHIIRGNEDQFTAMLKNLDNDPVLKSRAAHLHKIVNEPSRQAYNMKYHPDAKGAKNMGDDWTLPFQARQNSVKFNHQIHHQMDFGIGTI